MCGLSTNPSSHRISLVRDMTSCSTFSLQRSNLRSAVWQPAPFLNGHRDILGPLYELQRDVKSAAERSSACGLSTSPFSRMLLPPSWISSPPAHLLGASGGYSLISRTGLASLCKSKLWMVAVPDPHQLRLVHFESHCGLRSFEVLKRFLPSSLAATSQK